MSMFIYQSIYVIYICREICGKLDELTSADDDIIASADDTVKLISANQIKDPLVISTDESHPDPGISYF